MKRLTTAACVVALAVGAVACDKTPETPVVQTPGATLWEGDSVTFQTLYGGGSADGAQTNAGIGSTALKCVTAIDPNCLPAVTNTPLRVGEGEVDRILWALGLNDANPVNEGWTQTDADSWRVILNKVPAPSCMVLVLPGLGAGAAQTHKDEVSELRAWVTAYAATRPNTPVIDWQPYANDPTLMDKDGIHLRWVDVAGVDETTQAMRYAADLVSTPPQVDPNAAAVRADFYRSGLEQCT